MLFAQGGGTTQFSSIMLNLLAARKLANPTAGPPALDYVVSGSWSAKAYAEAVRMATLGKEVFATPRIAATSKPESYTALPSQYSFTKDAAYVYYCENETINGAQFGNGVQFPFDEVDANVPIVADYSSSFLSRPIPNLERHAIIYAGAQKNLGPSGVTVVIVRKDLLVDTGEAMKLGGIPSVPIQSEYKTLADNGSLYNTPPVFPIYVSALVLKKLKAKGLDEVSRVNKEKAETLYSALERAQTRSVVKIVVAPGSRSWMNVTFTVKDEAEFLKGAAERRFEQIKGHRSVGGERLIVHSTDQPRHPCVPLQRSHARRRQEDCGIHRRVQVTYASSSRV